MSQSNHKGTYKILELEKKVAEDKYKQRDFLEDLYKKPDGKKRLQRYLLKHQDPLQIKKIAKRNHENTRPEKRLSQPGLVAKAPKFLNCQDYIKFKTKVFREDWRPI